MKIQTILFLAGLTFALGLGISGMTDADKVLGFLNLAGPWDPSLAFVMVGAIGVHLTLYRLIVRREKPLYGLSFLIPTRADISPRLVIGSALFGAGWGIGGICPGPGIVSSMTFGSGALVFVGAMTGGMLLFHLVDAVTSIGRREHVVTARRTSAVTITSLAA